MECLFLVMCPKNLKIRICIVDDNLSLTFSSSRIDTLVRKAVQGIRNSRRQHHISSASILRRSFKATVDVSAPYRNTGKTKLRRSPTRWTDIIKATTQTSIVQCSRNTEDRNKWRRIAGAAVAKENLPSSTTTTLSRVND
ncbi:jg25775 [Pararge aegeria aegeria]|uniref:Jg25775 protein n=1 Tax=Pararge aegeria aegeria TaxID=348720 RepID=A0A8S4QYI8_9NEOP|nr:jg25775 [Pararge aegeria aegeria]